MKNKRIITTLVVLILLTTVVINIIYNNNTLRITEYKIENNLIPENFNNYKILQISDFHNNKNIKEKLISKIKEEGPDVIMITGDFIDSRKTNEEVSLSLIEEIIDIAPVYFVTGNHEQRINDYPEFEEKLETLGVHVLRNELTKLEKNGETINLIGIDDMAFLDTSSLLEERNIKFKTILTTLVEKEENFSLLLSHRPEYFEEYVENNIDLVLSGHTHAGQIKLPLIGGIYAPNQGLFPKYIYGSYKKNNTTMIVSAGLGNSLIGIRSWNNPEVVTVILKRK